MNKIENAKNEKLLADYKGIELDIIFFDNENKFDINHDSKGYVENSLENYLSYVAEKPLKIWLDFKNLNKENAAQSLEVLSTYLMKYNIDKSNVIIESENYKALGIYKEKGFYTSYYVPYLNLNELTNEQLKNEQNKLRMIIDSGNVSAISFPAYLYEYIKSTHLNKIDLLTWDKGGETERDVWYKTYFDKQARRMIYDDQVKVILVGDRRCKN
ncbi:hypothetical protein [Anaerosinus sp.]|uniref:hypothetical protein n=1 Tax=Selenobaculum sp. TaxID=3074374 RepID=UPI003AB4CFBD